MGDQHDEAWACFERFDRGAAAASSAAVATMHELSTPTRRVPSTTATAALQRWVDAARRGDRSELDALTAREYVVEHHGLRTEMRREYSVELETAHHQAIHGGGNWKMGRGWIGEWNWVVMETLKKREGKLGRRMTATEILKEVELLMKEREIPIRFVPYRGD